MFTKSRPQGVCIRVLHTIVPAQVRSKIPRSYHDRTCRYDRSYLQVRSIVPTSDVQISSTQVLVPTDDPIARAFHRTVPMVEPGNSVAQCHAPWAMGLVSFYNDIRPPDSSHVEIRWQMPCTLEYGFGLPLQCHSVAATKT